jgi:hypothetical protein
MLPLLEAINVLIKFTQGRDVFICDFVVAVKICQVDLFMMYYNLATFYQHEHFQLFCDVVENNFATITQDWVTNLNNV